jgi:electron transfer flavoprotein beta subunit
VRTLVFLEETPDVRVGIEPSGRTGYPMQEWEVRGLDEACVAALAVARSLDPSRETGHVAAVVLGDTWVESFLRLALASGAERVLRVWQPGLRDLGGAGRAMVYAAAAAVLGFDLILMGESDVVDMSTTRELTAELLGIPAIGAIDTLQVFPGDTPQTPGAAFQVTRVLEGGFREELAGVAPALLSVRASAAGVSPAPTAEALLKSSTAEIPLVGLAELGVPWDALRELDGRLSTGSLRRPRPPVTPIAAPESSLPAFNRIEGLVRGTVSAREGRLVHGTAEDLADALFDRLRDGDWLVPAQRGGN